MGSGPGGEPAEKRLKSGKGKVNNPLEADFKEPERDCAEQELQNKGAVCPTPPITKQGLGSSWGVFEAIELEDLETKLKAEAALIKPGVVQTIEETKKAKSIAKTQVHNTCVSKDAGKSRSISAPDEATVGPVTAMAGRGKGLVKTIFRSR